MDEVGGACLSAFSGACAGNSNQFEIVSVSKSVVMAFEEIISAIQGKPEIWMSSHPNFKNRLVKAKVWEELSAKLNIGEGALKKRWKHLKDQFRKELKKKPICRSGDGTDYWESTWQYFDMMTFVKDEMIPAPTTGNLCEDSTLTDTTQESEYRDENDPTIFSGPESPSCPCPPTSMSPAPSTASSSSQRLAKKRTTIREDMLEIERKKLLLMEKRLSESEKSKEKEEDEDSLYLKSILPCMKKLSDLQRFQLRGKINEWLVEAMTQNEHFLRQNQSPNSQPSPFP